LARRHLRPLGHVSRGVMSYGSVPAPGGRINGFSRPFTDKQIIFCASNSVSTAYFYLIFYFVFYRASEEPVHHDGFFHGLLATHLAIATLGFCSWLFIETHNPAIDTCFGAMLPDTKRWTEMKWCREHKVKLAGLDHFCVWLNVSISRSNYIPFLTLTVCGVLQYIIQTLTGLLVLTLWQKDMVSRTALSNDPHAYTYILAVVLNCAASVGIGFGFVMLLIFHIHLLSTGFSTYTYLIEQRKLLRPANAARGPRSKDQASDRQALVNGDKGIELPETGGDPNAV